MKPIHLFSFIAAFVGVLTLVASCTTGSPEPVTTKQQTIANAVEDTISIGLVPVLSKNPNYIPAAQSIAAALGSFSGTTITPADVDAVLSTAKLAPEDARAIAGIVNAAWAIFEKRYAEQVTGSVRPDVKLFLSAVGAGINSAIAAVPKPLALTAPPALLRFGALGSPCIGKA